jgi:hypothetical protein
MMRLASLLLLLTTASIGSVAADGQDLVGVWKPLNYHIAGVDHPMDGLFLFTENHYFATNVRYRQTSTELDDSNANAGTYRTEGNKLFLTSHLAAHIRPGKKEEPINYSQGGTDAGTYEIKGDKLIITFPSKNRYEAERVK